MLTQARASRRSLIAICGSLVLVIQLVGSAAAATPWVPQGLSESTKATALAAMSPNERAIRKPVFESSRYVVVSYARTVQSFDAKSGKPLGAAKKLAIGERASITPLSITNLTISISVTYDRDTPHYRWDIADFFDWTGRPPNGSRGKDQLGTAWANGLALNSDYAYGYYTAGGALISMNRNDMTPNVGTSWEFNECSPSDSCLLHYANWGYLLATIKETSLHGQDTNVVFKYFHTFEDLSYGISFSGSGPSISITPQQSVTSTAVFASFVN